MLFKNKNIYEGLYYWVIPVSNSLYIYYTGAIYVVNLFQKPICLPTF